MNLLIFFANFLLLVRWSTSLSEDSDDVTTSDPSVWLTGYYTQIPDHGHVIITFDSLENVINLEVKNFNILLKITDESLSLPTITYTTSEKQVSLGCVKNDLVLFVNVSSEMMAAVREEDARISVERFNLDTDDWSPILTIPDSSSKTPARRSDTGRKRRRGIYDNMTEDDCRLTSLYFDFTKFSSLIVHPAVLNIKQCTGSCRAPYNSPVRKFSNYHTQFQEILGRYGDRTSRRPHCCVPLEYASTTVDYYNSKTGNLEKRTYQNAVVTKCGCR